MAPTSALDRAVDDAETDVRSARVTPSVCAVPNSTYCRTAIESVLTCGETVSVKPVHQVAACAVRRSSTIRWSVVRRESTESCQRMSEVTVSPATAYRSCAVAAASSSRGSRSASATRT